MISYPILVVFQVSGQLRPKARRRQVVPRYNVLAIDGQFAACDPHRCSDYGCALLIGC
jgi:hypothetical protein